MKLAQSLAFITTGSASIFIPFALANLDFQIAKVVDQELDGDGLLLACPSDNYNCECFEGGVHAAEVSEWSSGKPLASLPENGSFSVESPAGICGSPRLDFYQESDGPWYFYVNGGDGISKGTCNSTFATMFCSHSNVYDQLLCNSDICPSP